MPDRYGSAMQYRVLKAISSSEFEVEHFTPSDSFNIQWLINIVFISVSAFLLYRFTRKIQWINGIKKNFPSFKKNGVTIVQTDLDNAPFSFLSTIYWRNDIPMEGMPGRSIMAHELTHVRLKHSADKIFMEIVLIFFWMNPFYWLISKELTLQHEFAADDAAASGNGKLLSLILLQTHFSPKFPKIVHSFFHSPIKRRLFMINLKGKTRFVFFRKMMIVPILCSAVILFSYHSKPNSNSLNRSAKTIKLVLDAGHGGTDNGAIGNDATREKDLNLQITKKITELAPEYNISILPIRTEDETIDPKQRLVKSEKLGGDLYVSIHVNKLEDKNAGPADGYTIVVSGENQKLEQSKDLASALIARLGNGGIPFRLEEVTKVWVLKKNQLPAILLECGNIDNPADLIRLTTNSSLESMSRNILSGIVDFSDKK